MFDYCNYIALWAPDARLIIYTKLNEFCHVES